MTHKTFSIMIIDDDPHIREIFRLVMDYHQMPLCLASNAKSAMAYLAERLPDVIVVDLFLPDIDGYRALDSIRAAFPGSGCKFVATTAYYSADTQYEVMKRGFDGYIQKPVNATQLVPYLRSVVCDES